MVLSDCQLLDVPAVGGLDDVGTGIDDARLDGLARLDVEGVHGDAVGIDDVHLDSSIQVGRDDNLMLAAADAERAESVVFLWCFVRHLCLAVVSEENAAGDRTRTAGRLGADEVGTEGTDVRCSTSGWNLVVAAARSVEGIAVGTGSQGFVHVARLEGVVRVRTDVLHYRSRRLVVAHADMFT